MTPGQRFDDLHDKLKQRYPKFGIVQKDDWLLMRILNSLMFFTSFNSFYTTIGYKVGWVTGSTPGEDIYHYEILRHEARHIKDYDTFRWLFLWTYTYPTWIFVSPLVAYSLLLNPDAKGFAFTAGWVAFAIISQLMRAFWEYRGYRESMYAMFELNGLILDSDIEFIGKQFWGPNYLFMLPCPPLVRWLLKRTRRKIMAGEFVSDLLE